MTVHKVVRYLWSESQGSPIAAQVLTKYELLQVPRCRCLASVPPLLLYRRDNLSRDNLILSNLPASHPCTIHGTPYCTYVQLTHPVVPDSHHPTPSPFQAWPCLHCSSVETTSLVVCRHLILTTDYVDLSYPYLCHHFFLSLSLTPTVGVCAVSDTLLFILEKSHLDFAPECGVTTLLPFQQQQQQQHHHHHHDQNWYQGDVNPQGLKWRNKNDEMRNVSVPWAHTVPYGRGWRTCRLHSPPEIDASTLSSSVVGDYSDLTSKTDRWGRRTLGQTSHKDCCRKKKQERIGFPKSYLQIFVLGFSYYISSTWYLKEILGALICLKIDVNQSTNARYEIHTTRGIWFVFFFVLMVLGA